MVIRGIHLYSVFKARCGVKLSKISSYQKNIKTVVLMLAGRRKQIRNIEKPQK